MWQKLRNLQRRAIDTVRAGVKAGEAYDNIRRQAETENIWFYGHGLGLFVHDPPMLTPYYEDGWKTTTNISSSWELEPNMVVVVEFGLNDYEGGQGYFVEDVVVVTEGSPRILTDVMDTTELFVIE